MDRWLLMFGIESLKSGGGHALKPKITIPKFPREPPPHLPATWINPPPPPPAKLELKAQLPGIQEVASLYRHVFQAAFLPLLLAPTFGAYFYSQEQAEERQSEKYSCLLSQHIRKNTKADTKPLPQVVRPRKVLCVPIPLGRHQLRTCLHCLHSIWGFFSAEGVVRVYQPQCD